MKKFKLQVVPLCEAADCDLVWASLLVLLDGSDPVVLFVVSDDAGSSISLAVPQGSAGLRLLSNISLDGDGSDMSA